MLHFVHLNSQNDLQILSLQEEYIWSSKYVHSMALGNLNKSKKTKARTTTALKIAP